MKKYDWKAVGLLLMLTITLPMQVAVGKENIEAGVNWIILGESPLLDRSSKYLHKGQVKRGLRYARKALQRQLSPEGLKIAHHNLCLGYLSLGEEQNAVSHCDDAQLNMPSGHYLKKVSEDLYRVTSFRSDSIELPALESVVARNLEIHGITADKHRVVRLMLEN